MAACRKAAWQETGRRVLLRRGLGMALGLGLLSLGGCGWAPLYADPEAGPADAELRAIKVAPIPERIGQNLAQALRQTLNPTGEPTPQRYLLRITLQTLRQDLGVQTQGFGTRGRLDAIAASSSPIVRAISSSFRASPTSPKFVRHPGQWILRHHRRRRCADPLCRGTAPRHCQPAYGVPATPGGRPRRQAPGTP